MRPYGPRVGPTRDSGRPRSPGASPAVDVRVHRHILEPRSGRGRPRLSSMGPEPIASRTVGRFHRRMRRSPGRERVRVNHGRPAASRSARDRCRVPFVDVHGTGPSRGGPCDADRPRGDAVGEGPWHSARSPARLGARRICLSAPRLRTDTGDATVPRSSAPSECAFLQENGASREAFLKARCTHASLHIRP